MEMQWNPSLMSVFIILVLKCGYFVVVFLAPVEIVNWICVVGGLIKSFQRSPFNITLDVGKWWSTFFTGFCHFIDQTTHGQLTNRWWEILLFTVLIVSKPPTRALTAQTHGMWWLMGSRPIPLMFYDKQVIRLHGEWWRRQAELTESSMHPNLHNHNLTSNLCKQETSVLWNSDQTVRHSSADQIQRTVVLSCPKSGCCIQLVMKVSSTTPPPHPLTPIHWILHQGWGGTWSQCGCVPSSPGQGSRWTPARVKHHPWMLSAQSVPSLIKY